MEQKTITVTLRGEAADRLREAQAAEPKRIDWSAFSRLLQEGGRRAEA